MADELLEKYRETVSVLLGQRDELTAEQDALKAELERLQESYAAAQRRHELDYQFVADQLFASCICDCNPETTDGPEEDCPVHGMEEFRPLALRDRTQRAEAELAEARAAIERARTEAQHLLDHSTNPITNAAARRFLAALDAPQPAARKENGS